MGSIDLEMLSLLYLRGKTQQSLFAPLPFLSIVSARDALDYESESWLPFYIQGSLRDVAGSLS